MGHYGLILTLKRCSQASARDTLALKGQTPKHTETGLARRSVWPRRRPRAPLPSQKTQPSRHKHCSSVLQPLGGWLAHRDSDQAQPGRKALYRPPDVSQRSVTHVTELYLLRHHVFHWLADALPSATQRARSDRPDDKRSLLCYEQALPGAQGAAAKVCGFRLRVPVSPAAAERATVGACMTMRSWRGSGGLCAVLAMRDGGGGKNFGYLRPVGGLRRARGV